MDGSFKGARDLPTYSKGWLPEGGATALVLLVHGLGAHCQKDVRRRRTTNPMA
jgi:alpha-beta hydrolase superfamily lysophospholipase